MAARGTDACRSLHRRACSNSLPPRTDPARDRLPRSLVEVLRQPETRLNVVETHGVSADARKRGRSASVKHCGLCFGCRIALIGAAKFGPTDNLGVARFSTDLPESNSDDHDVICVQGVVADEQVRTPTTPPKNDVTRIHGFDLTC